MLELREKEIWSMLEKLKDLNFVLIGGYAINAYGQPRFSVDCDIVVLNTNDADKIKEVLMKEGYKKKEIHPNTPYFGEFLCLEKKINNFEIPFDILIGGVIDRKTKSKFPAGEIFKRSQKRILYGKSIPKQIELRIADPEILIVMKLAAGRKSDYRDVFILLDRKIDFDYINSQIGNYNLKNQLNRFIEYIKSRNFKDSLQGVFGKVDEELFGKIVEKINLNFLL